MDFSRGISSFRLHQAQSHGRYLFPQQLQVSGWFPSPATIQRRCPGPRSQGALPLSGSNSTRCCYRCPLPAGSSILLQSASKFDPATNALPVPSSSEQSDACEMPGTPNLRQRSSHQLLATQQLPFMPGLLLRRGGRCPSMPRIMMVCIEHRGRAPIRLAPLTGDGRRLPGIGWTWSLFCRRRDPSPDACLSSGCPRISLSIFCLLSMRAAPHHARPRASWKRARAQAPAVHRAGGGQHCGLCNLWMEKRFHARTSTSSSTFPSPSGRPSPQFNSSHTFGPPVSCFPPTLFCLSVVPPSSPPNRGVATAPGGPSDPRLVRHPSSLLPCPLPCPSPPPAPASVEVSWSTTVPRYLFFFCSPSLWRCWRGSAAACAVGPATSVVSTSAVSIKTHTSPPLRQQRAACSIPYLAHSSSSVCPSPVQSRPSNDILPPPQVPAVSRHFYISMSIDPRPTTTTRLNSTARSEKGQPVFPVSPAPVIPPTILSTSLVGKETDPTNLVAAPSPSANITATPTPAHPDPRQ